MRRATVTIPDDLADAMDTYINDQEARPNFTAVMQAALRQYLKQKGYLRTRSTLRITPARQGSGRKDISVNHDRYLAAR